MNMTEMLQTKKNMAEDTMKGYYAVLAKEDAKLNASICEVISKHIATVMDGRDCSWKVCVCSGGADITVHFDVKLSENGDVMDSKRSLDMSYRKTYNRSDDRRKRLMINPSCGGSFIAESLWVDYYAVVGALARSLAEIESEIEGIDMSEYDAAYMKYDIARRDYDHAKADYDNLIYAEKEREMNENLASISRDSKIQFGTRNKWETSTSGEAVCVNIPVYKKIDRVTPRFVFLRDEGDGRCSYVTRLRRETLLKMFIAGEVKFVA